MADNKRYLIEFLATVKGDKAVTKSLKSMEKGQKKLKKATDRGTKSAGRWDKSMLKVAKRAMMVAPMWLLLRSSMMLVVSTIREVISANMDFQVQMARIKTVVSASSTSIDSDMAKIRSTILETAGSSTASLKDLAEAFYFLRTSNLSTEEAMAAFRPSVDLAIGTLNKLGETARTVAGIYATLKNKMGENMSVTEKFNKIADGLAYTYATQEVQMSELLQSYIKIAPYIGGLKESWTEIITVLGYLNTKQLKAGRTGRLLGRSIIQLMKNSKQLAHIFGITYSKDAPLSFLKILREINKAQAGGAATAGQREKLFKIFATRGQVAPSLLLEDMKGLDEALANAEESMDGFTSKMAEIMKKTVPAQMQRTKNLLAVLANEFFSAASGGGDFVGVLVKINNSLDDMREPVKEVGLLIGWLTDNMLQFSKVFNMDANQKRWGKNLLKFSPQMAGLLTTLEGLQKLNFMPFDLQTYAGYVDSQKEGATEIDERTDTQSNFKSLNTETSKALMNNKKAEQVIQKNIVKLMKSRGATEVEIAEYKIKSFREISMWMDEEENYSKRLALINDKINAEYTERIKATKSLVSHHQKLHQIFGADSVEAAKLNYEIQRILFGENDVTRTLKAKLNLEKEILAAKRGQYQYTSDEAKVMEVYKKHGEDIARTMANVLTGQVAPKNLDKKELIAFKAFFPQRQKAEEVRKFYEEDEGISLKSIFDRDKRRQRSSALRDAKKLRKTYDTPAISKEQINMEISKITLPQPMDVNVKAEVTVDVNRENLEADVTRIVNDAIRSAKNKKYIQKQVFDADE